MVKTAAVSALSHSAFPYLEVADIDTGKGEFNVGFNYNPTDLNTKLSYPGLEFTPLQRKGHFVKADMWFDNTETEADLTIALSYRKDRFEDAYIKTLIDKLERLLKYCINDKGATLATLKNKVVSDRIDTVKNKNLTKLKSRL